MAFPKDGSTDWDVKTLISNSDHEKSYGIAAPVTFWWPDADGSVRVGGGMTRDISSRAVRINTIECPPPGTPIQVAIYLTQSHGRRHGVTLQGEGVVIRVAQSDDDQAPSYGHRAGFEASVQFYSEAQAGPNKSDEIFSKAVASPGVN